MRKFRMRDDERGSALLVTLMVMVGLSLLGLGFVTISETESAISVNERNYTQTLQVAEAGAKLAAEWFNAPDWANANGLLPLNQAAIKRQRPSGYYKESGGLLFDTPFKGSDEDRFFGIDYDNADIVINETTLAGTTDEDFLDDLNEALFTDNDEGGRITEIRVFAPPIVGGTKVTQGGFEFWSGATMIRYGVATLAVTAEKTLANQVVARRTVKMVVSEFPFPGPEGPLQSNAGINAGGAFRVHWGRAISLNDLFNQRNHTSLPWIDSWTPIQYEMGYADSIYDGTSPKYLDELIGKSFEDPWFEVRARENLLQQNGNPVTNTDPQPWPYSNVNYVENGKPFGPGNVADAAGYSGQFQQQNVDNQAQNKRETIFVRPVYSVWKQIALTGATQQGIYYLRYKNGEWYDVRGESRTFEDWVNVKGSGEEGFFFFDTTTGADPQNPDGTTNTDILTPLDNISGNAFQMRGFFYLNAEELNVAGTNNQDFGYYNAPGEPFRDIGFHYVDPASGKLQCEDPGGGSAPVDCDVNPGAQWFRRNETNFRWDYQDVKDNDQFDYIIAPYTFTPPGTDSTAPGAEWEWKIVPYVDGCDPGVDCSEPHEPYLNLVFAGAGTKAVTGGGAGEPEPWAVGWQDPDDQSRMSKVTDNGKPSGNLETCSSNDAKDGGTSNETCTSNAYDELGPMLSLGANTNSNPILDGVIYNEGDYTGTGSPLYYGSILIWGEVDTQGTPDVWYDYKLTLGNWQDRFENLPRTIVTSIETDQ